MVKLSRISSSDESDAERRLARKPRELLEYGLIWCITYQKVLRDVYGDELRLDLVKDWSFYRELVLEHGPNS